MKSHGWIANNPARLSACPALEKWMKLRQGQVWKVGEEYVLIVHWERLAIGYETMKDLTTREGTHHQATKKEFCRLLKNATLLNDEAVRELSSPQLAEPPLL